MFDAIRVRVKARHLNAELAQVRVDNVIFLEQLEKLVAERDVKTVEETDGFLNFLSNSRDWAFDYIEDVQQALRAYDIALSTDDAKLMNEAYTKLISFLPNDDVVN